MPRNTKASTGLDDQTSSPGGKEDRYKAATWRLLFIYPRFVLLSPLFDHEEGSLVSLDRPSSTDDLARGLPLKVGGGISRLLDQMLPSSSRTPLVALGTS
jgi:hypothetical protein